MANLYRTDMPLVRPHWARLAVVALALATSPLVPTKDAVAAPKAETCPHRLVLDNQSGHAVDLALAGQPWKLLGAGKRTFVCQTATVTWQVRDPAGQWLQHGSAEPQATARQVVVLQQPPGALRLVNIGGEPVVFAVDGNQQRPTLPGQVAEVAMIPAGRHEVTATGQQSRHTQRWQVDVRAGQTTRLATARGKARLTVRNDREEPIDLAVDGLRIGALQPGEVLTIGGLGKGEHVLERVGQRSGRKTTDKATAEAMTTDDGEVAEERAPQFALTIYNRTGETLQIPAMLKAYAADLPADASATWHLPRGTYGFDLMGETSGLRYHRDVLPRTAAIQSWSIVRPRAILKLVNDDLLALEVQLGDERTLTIPARSHALLRLPAGRWKLKALPKDRPEVVEALTLQPFEEATWRIAARPTWLTIRNGWTEPLQVWVGDVVSGEIAAGSDKRLPLAPGQHQIVLRSRWSNQFRQIGVDLRAGDTVTVVSKPPGGVLALDNRGNGGPWRVRLDGGEPVDVPAEGRLLLPVAAGQHLLEGELLDPEPATEPKAPGAKTATALVRVRPGAHLDVPGAALVAISTAVNCSGQTVYFSASTLPDHTALPAADDKRPPAEVKDGDFVLTLGPRGGSHQAAYVVASKDRKYVWLLRPSPDRDDAELHLVLPGAQRCPRSGLAP